MAPPALAPPSMPMPTPPDARQAVAQARRWYWQRISAMVLALCVVVHLATIVYAVRSGLGADALLARTRGSFLVGGFYAVFVIASSVHVPIGLARIAEEWIGWRGRGVAVFSWLAAATVAGLGLRAVYAVVAT